MTTMRFNFVLLRVLACSFLLTTATVATPTAPWHKPGQPLCTPTGCGICNLGFTVETFPYQETNGVVTTPPAIYTTTIYDHACNVVASANSTDTVATPNSWFSDTEPPHFEISTPIGEVKISGYRPTSAFICFAEWRDGGCMAPVFKHGEKQEGGKKGCSCGNSGLGKGLKWACQCAFDCSVSADKP